MLVAVQEVRSQHWACGTEVVEQVPEGYDLSEGIALVCPRCQDAWWHYPEAALATAALPAPAQPPAPEPPPASPPRAQEPDAEPAGTGSNGRAAHAEHMVTAAIDHDEVARGAWPPEPPDDVTERRRPAGPTGKATDWLGPILIVAGLAVVGLRLADVGQHQERPAPPPPASTAPAAPSNSRTAPPRPSGPPSGRTLVTSGPGFSLRRPAGWSLYREGGATVVAPGGAAVSVRVYVAGRPDLSLEGMGRLSVRTLRATFPGATVSAPRRVRLGGRDALLVTARKGTIAREWTAVAAGSERFIIDLRAAEDATLRQRALAQATVRSFRAL